MKSITGITPNDNLAILAIFLWLNLITMIVSNSVIKWGTCLWGNFEAN